MWTHLAGVAQLLHRNTLNLDNLIAHPRPPFYKALSGFHLQDLSEKRCCNAHETATPLQETTSLTRERVFRSIAAISDIQSKKSPLLKCEWAKTPVQKRNEKTGEKTETRSNAAALEEQTLLAGLQLLHFVFIAAWLLRLDGICLDICPSGGICLWSPHFIFWKHADPTTVHHQYCQRDDKHRSAAAWESLAVTEDLNNTRALLYPHQHPEGCKVQGLTLVLHYK